MNLLNMNNYIHNKASLIWKLLLSICILVIVSCSAEAQKYFHIDNIHIKLLTSSGKVIQENKIIEVGMLINPKSNFITDSSTYILLLLNDSLIFELFGKNQYSLEDLLVDFNLQENKAINKYSNYVIRQLVSNSEHYQQFNKLFEKKSALNKHRGMLSINLPTFNYLFNKKLVLIYNHDLMPDEIINNFIIIGIDQDNNVVFSKDTIGRQIHIDISKITQSDIVTFSYIPKKMNGELFLPPDCCPHIFVLNNTFWREINYEKVKLEYNKIFSFVGTTPFNKLLEAYFFDEHELYADAVASFEEAIRLSGNAKEFVDFYNAFYKRHIKE